MPNQLLIYLQPDQALLHWQWQEGDRRMPEQRGGWTQLADSLSVEQGASIPTTLILPAEMISLCQVQLPSGQARYLKQALAYAVEDKLTLDSSAYHLVPVGKPRAGQLEVIAVERKLFSSLLQQCAELSLNLLRVVVDADLISEPGQLAIVSEGPRLLFRTQNAMLAAELSWLATTVPRLLDSTSVESVKVTSISIEDHPSGANLLQAELANLVDVPVSVENWEGSALSLMQSLLSRHHTVNLLAGEFARRSEQTNYWHRFMPVAWAASLFLVVYLGVGLVEARRLALQSEAYARANEYLCKDIFGPDKKCREQQLKKEVQFLLARGVPADSARQGMLPILSDLGDMLSDNLTLQSVRFNGDKQEMLTVIHGESFQQLEQLKQALEQKGYQAELSASQDQGTSRGNFRIVAMEANQ